MAANILGRNIAFKIYNSDGTEFEGLVLTKATFETVVMSLGDKISGDVYYKDNALVVTMSEYITYNGVKYMLVNPPTIVREGMAADNGEMRGMTKYSFTFYHPMCLLSNFPFTDVAVTSAQTKYLSQNKTFSWIGNLTDYVAKLNKNLEGTEWVVEIGDTVTSDIYNKLSAVMPFDKVTVADALKTGYETWEVPYVIDVIASTDARYALGKRFLVRFGLPSQEILDANNNPFVFQFGKGVGLKNNSRTPRNNKIVTRIAGYGSENNVPYGYPQIVWTGNQDWDYTINNDSTAANSYPIYDGIVNGQRVRLIKHPFTRTHLMPSVYSDTVNKKVNPNATGYDPTIEIKDYYDAISSQEYTYPNPINPLAPSYEIHEFEDIKPELGAASIVGISAYDLEKANAISVNDCLALLMDYYSESHNETEKEQLQYIMSVLPTAVQDGRTADEDSYEYDWSLTSDDYYAYLKYKSSILNFTYIVLRAAQAPEPVWDDTMDDDGNYKQSYFKITLPTLSFDLYACAAITEEMQVNMRSGACIGCTFPIMVDWDDYKKNFYDADGNFDPVIGEGHPRNGDKYPDSSSGQITVVVQKDNQTFGVLMPNIYQKPTSGDQFVILGISLPLSYVTAAETRLDDAMIDYMRSNNVYYFDYPLKFDEHFLATHTNILSQMKTNTIVRFKYAGETLALYIKQMAVKFGVAPLPQYDITLTDDVEVVLNPVNKVADEVSRLSVVLNQGQSVDLEMLYAKFDERYDQRYISKINDDTAAGLVRLIRGLQVGERFVTGLLGEGGVFREESDGTTYLECDKLYVRMKAYFDTVEIRKFLHSGGNRIASLAGIKCSRVEYIDANGDVTDDATDAVKFRCYFRADDNGETVTNDFVVGDLAFCKETNAQVGSGVEQHGYWRAVVGKNSTLTNDGEGWIDLSASDCLTGSDIPIAQDDIIQLGNKNDTTRQGAIVEYVGGADAPSYQIYQGINTYSLENKNYVSMGYNSSTGRAYLNVYGDFRFGAKTDSGSYISYNEQTGVLNVKAKINASSTIGNQSLTEYIQANQNNYDDSWIEPALQDIQDQIDGELDTWYYQGVPTLNNLPASTWTTDDEKKKHIGDLYYDKDTGYVYRFLYDDENETYYWTQIHDDAISEALRIANEAQDTADNKRRVFLQQPVPPYDAGDLWVNANYTDPSTQQVVYSNDILKCITGKTDGQSFSINDWTKASKYTDDSKLLTFLDGYQGTLTQVQDQIDKKAETWHQNTDPSTAWNTAALQAEHVGDLWYCTADIASTNYKKDTTWCYVDKGSGASPRYVWEQQNVPQEVFDEIDGKVAIYIEWGAWINQTTGENELEVKDLFIPSSDTTQGGVAYKANKVYRCTNASTPTFQEINYTDDTTVNSIITKYGQILGLVNPSGESVGEALAFLRQVLTGNTTVDGGLILTHMIALKNGTAITAGINGELDSTLGTQTIAAWYGGQMVDHELSPSASNYAKTLFRFDGTGYLAGGNIKWNADGSGSVAGGNIAWNAQGNITTLNGQAITATSITINGNSVVTQDWVTNNFVTKSFFNALFTALQSDNTPIPVNDPNVATLIASIKANVGFWTNQYISSLGQNSSGGGGGGGTGDVTWDLLASSSDTRPIAHSHLSEALANYALTAQIPTNNNQLSNGAGYITSSALNGYATQLWVTTQGYSTPSSVSQQMQTYANLTNGVITIGDNSITPITSVSGTIWGKSFTNGGTISGTISAGNNGGAIEKFHSIELNSAGTLSNYGGFIDFHFYDSNASFVSTADYTTRIIESAVGVISILAKNNDATNDSRLAGLVVGASYDGSYVQIGNVRLVYDSNNNALKVVGSNGTSSANFYATGSVSALGYGAGGGGGTGDVTWDLLADNTDTRQIAQSHLTTALTNYALTSQLSAYLLKDGSVAMTGDLSLVYGTASSDQWISFKASDNIVYKIGIRRPFSNYGLTFAAGSSFYKIWHEGNLTKVSQLTNDAGYATTTSLGNYLPLTAGSSYPLTSILYITSSSYRHLLVLNQTGDSAIGSYIVSRLNGKNKTSFGYDSSKGFFVDIYKADETLDKSFVIGSTGVTFDGNKVWHEGNDGSGSGLDADLLDGLDSTYFLRDPWSVSGGLYDARMTFRVFNTTTEVGLGLRKKDTGYITFLGLKDAYGYIAITNSSGSARYFQFYYNGNFSADGTITGGAIKTQNGTSSQFLKADGSVDSNTYATTSQLAGYLPLTGGTLTGGLTFSYGGATNDQWINFVASDNVTYRLGIQRPFANYGLAFYDGSSYYKIWHEGNDGTGSGLDADLLDGQHGSYYAAASALNDYLPLTGGTLTNSAYGSALHIVRNASNGNVVIRFSNNDTVIGRCLGFDGGQAAASGLYFTDNNNGTAYTVISSGNISSYNAGSATKLQTARTLWGQSFDGTANVTGNLTSVGNITSSNTYFDLIASSGSEIRLRIDSSVETSSLSFASSWFGPFTASKDAISLGRSTARWASLYANNANFYSTGAQVISLTRNASSGGALIGYYANNQSTNVWNVGAGYNYAFIFEYGGSEKVTLTNDGKLGIGKTSPSYALDVDGAIQSTAYRCAGGNLMTCTVVGAATYTMMTWILNSTRAEFEFPNKTNSSSGEHIPIYVGWRGGVYSLVLASNANVGIGTNSPSSKLHVNGSIKANGNVVSDTSGGYLEGFSSWELNTNNTAGTNIGGFLDFHYNGTAQDYSVRLIEKDYSGVLQLMAKDTGTGNAQRAGLIVGAGTYTSFIQIGNGRIVWDDTNHALRIVDKDGNACNMYATGGVSALGYQSGGGGGGTGVFSTNITPDTTGTYDIGTSTYKWRNIYLCGASDGSNGFSIITNYSGYTYIGSVQKVRFGCNVDFDDWIYIENRMMIGGNNSNYDLYVWGENDGNAYFGDNVSVGSLTNRSDMRLKDVVGDVNLSIQQIASAPTFKFRFKEKAKRTMVGTSAQYWDAVLPESVTRDADGILGLDYGVTALVSTIILAKGMTEHERRITKLEMENAELRARIKDLEER